MENIFELTIYLEWDIATRSGILLLGMGYCYSEWDIATWNGILLLGMGYCYLEWAFEREMIMTLRSRA